VSRHYHQSQLHCINIILYHHQEPTRGSKGGCTDILSYNH
jgi:hypothetical protein